MFVFDIANGLEQVSLNVVTTDESETFGGSPAISSNRMFLRSNKALYCVADTGESIPPNASQQFIAKVEDNENADGGNRFGGRGGAGNRGGAGGRGGFGGRGGGSSFNPSAIFDQRDADKDGKITREELAGNPMAERMMEMDKDGDKAISKEEFTAGIGTLFSRGSGGSGRSGGRGGFGQGEDNRPKRPERPVASE